MSVNSLKCDIPLKGISAASNKKTVFVNRGCPTSMYHLQFSVQNMGARSYWPVGGLGALARLPHLGS